VPEIGEPAVREIIHGAYRIIYEIFPGRETIMCCASGTAREASRKLNDGLISESPQGWGIFGLGFYKDVAPAALGKSSA